MKSERRHELQRNALADIMGRWISESRRYAPAVMATIAAVVVLLAVYLIVSSRSANAEKLACANTSKPPKPSLPPWNA